MFNVAVGTAGRRRGRRCSATTRWAADRSPTTACAMPAPTTPRRSATTSCARSSTPGPTSAARVSATGSPCCRPSWAAAPMRIDLNSNRVLASIWYWNYGDYNPISHHLCAFPSADPYTRLRVRQLHPGRPELADLRHADRRHGGDRPRGHQHLSRALRRHADGADGERLGDHRARARRARHGQPEGRAVLLRDRRPEGHRRLLRPHDVQGQGGAALRLDAQRRAICATPGRRAARSPSRRSIPIRRPASTTTRAPRATRSTGRWCRWASCSSRKARCPATIRSTLTGADGTIWHPEGRWAATVVRLCGGIAILDPEKNFDPVAFLQFNKDSQDQYPVEQVDKDTLERRVRQDPFAGPRDRLLARRQVPRA